MPMPRNDTYRFKKEFEKGVAEMNGKKKSPSITPKKTDTSKDTDFLEESRKRLKDREPEFKKPDNSSKEKIRTAFSDTKGMIDTQNEAAARWRSNSTGAQKSASKSTGTARVDTQNEAAARWRSNSIGASKTPRVDTEKEAAARWKSNDTGKTRSAVSGVSAIESTLRKAFAAKKDIEGSAPNKTSGDYVKNKGYRETPATKINATSSQDKGGETVRQKKMTAAQVEAKRAKQAAYKAKQDAKKAAQRQKVNNAQAKKKRR